MIDVPYQSAVGSLMYSMVGTRPDLAYAIGMMWIHEQSSKDSLASSQMDS